MQKKPEWTSPAAEEEERFPLFMEAVCRQCAYSGYSCGCEQGDDNPAFVVLRAYSSQYTSWRDTTLNDKQENVEPDEIYEQPKWIVIDVTMGLGNNLLAYVNGLLLSLCLGRALAINTHDAYPLNGVLDLMLENDIPSFPPGTRLPHTNFYLDQASDLSQLTCGEMRHLDDYHIVHVRSANQDPHLILSNPKCGAYLNDAFRGLPFFFLSHFVWPGQHQKNARHTFVSSPTRQE